MHKVELHIRRNSKYPRTFFVQEFPELTALVKRSSGFVLHRLQIFKNGELCYNVMQPDVWRHIFWFVAFLWKDLPPLSFFCGDECIGRSIKLERSGCYTLSIRGVVYQTILHHNNYVSIWIGDRQVALFHTNGAGIYDIKYDLFDPCAPELLFLICLIIDCFQYEYAGGTRVYYVDFKKREYDSAIDWLPRDQ